MAGSSPAQLVKCNRETQEEETGTSTLSSVTTRIPGRHLPSWRPAIFVTTGTAVSGRWVQLAATLTSLRQYDCARPSAATLQAASDSK